MKRPGPEFNPIPEMTLREVIEQLAAEACAQERFIRRVLSIPEREALPPHRKVMALDYACKLLEAIAPDWPAHKELIRRRQQSRR